VTAQGHFIKLAGYPGHDQGRDGLDREPCGGEHDKKQDCGAHAGSTVLVRRHLSGARPRSAPSVIPDRDAARSQADEPIRGRLLSAIRRRY
jgi:hypothetical protein